MVPTEKEKIKAYIKGLQSGMMTNRDGATSAGIGTMGHVTVNFDLVIPTSRVPLVMASVGRGTTRLEIAPSVG